MARTIVESDRKLFGALGMKDPVVTYPQITIGREIDFSQANVMHGKSVPFMPIPAGFVITAIATIQTEKCNDDVSITLGAESSDANLVTVELKDDSPKGEAFHRNCTPVANGFYTAADMLCIDGDSAKDITEGRLAVYLIGFQAFAEGVKTTPDNATHWRETLQTKDNVSGGQMDPRKFEGFERNE